MWQHGYFLMTLQFFVCFSFQIRDKELWSLSDMQLVLNKGWSEYWFFFSLFLNKATESTGILTKRNFINKTEWLQWANISWLSQNIEETLSSDRRLTECSKSSGGSMRNILWLCVKCRFLQKQEKPLAHTREALSRTLLLIIDTCYLTHSFTHS